MKAIRSHSGDISLDSNAPDPTPRPGEALVTPSRLAIDAADLNRAAAFSGVLGQEFVGRVQRLELPDDHPLTLRLNGKRVVGSAHIPCGTCESCRSGLSLHCPQATTLGLDRDGCYAQSFTLPATNLVPIPDALDDDHAVFAHSLGRVIHAMRMLRLEGKTFVSVLGDEPVALLAAQAMTKSNASVRLLGDHEESLGICDRWGIKHRPQHEVGRRRDQDVVFDCTGSPESVALALQLVRPRGSVIIMRSTPGASLNAADIMRDEIQVFGSRGSAVADAVAELAAGRIDVVSLIVRRLQFDDGPAAIRAAAQPGTLKILLDAA